MSKFNEYARKVNAIARAAMDGYKEAADKAHKADTRYNETVSRYRGSSSPEAAAAIARAKADMLSIITASSRARNFFMGVPP